MERCGGRRKLQRPVVHSIARERRPESVHRHLHSALDERLGDHHGELLWRFDPRDKLWNVLAHRRSSRRRADTISTEALLSRTLHTTSTRTSRAST
jgi:hypothetical protein